MELNKRPMDEWNCPLPNICCNFWAAAAPSPEDDEPGAVRNRMVSLALEASSDTRRMSSGSPTESSFGSLLYKKLYALEPFAQSVTSILLHSNEPELAFFITLPSCMRQFKFKTMSEVAGKKLSFHASPNGGVCMPN